MNKRIVGLLIAALLAGGLVAVVSAAEGMPWVGAEPAVNLSQNNNVLAESNMALGPDNRVAVIWSGATAPRGVFLAQTQGSDWTTTTLASTGNQETWNPAVTYSGTKVIAAWAQGAKRDLRTSPRAVMQKDEGLDAQTIITPVFGNVEIGLIVAPTGMHMIFAATTNTSPTIVSKFPWDLYYTHRYLTETTWSPPTVIITYAQVIPAEIWNTNMTAGIWEPRLAANADGTQLNLVWRQEHSVTTAEPATYFTYTTWYASGSWQSGHVNWSVPQQVSPPEQKYTIRPNVAAGPTGKVHIVWTELIPSDSGGITRPEAQYINYRQLGGPASARISGAAIKVNAQQPTRASSSVAVSGKHLCVAWHGFYVGDKEEIILRCSQDEGATWQALINATESPTLLSFFPTVRINAAGQVHIAWVEYILDVTDLVPYDLFYRTGTSEVTQVFLPVVMRRR
jgi:hypothetical protein